MATSYTRKKQTNTRSDGTAIAIPHGLAFRILDDFMSDLLGAEITTATGKVIVATLYQPSTRGILPVPDFVSLFPVYVVSDLHCQPPFPTIPQHEHEGETTLTLDKQQKTYAYWQHFLTLLSSTTATSPDIILTINNTYHNIYIAQGDLPTGDHLPIILTISVKPILVPAPWTRDYRRANWDIFKEEPDAQFSAPGTPMAPRPTVIDEQINK